MEKAETGMKCDKLRAQSRINIGSSFDRWRKLRQDLGLKSDADTAEFLLNSYETSPLSSTPMETGVQGASTIFSESDSDRGADFSDEGVRDLAVISPKRTSLMELDASVVPQDPSVDIDENQFNNIRNSIIDWDSDDETCTPEMDTELFSASEEEDSGEVDEYEDGYDDEYEDEYEDEDDPDYRPPIRVKTGGALKSKFSLDTLQIVSMEETVHDEPDNDSATAQAGLPNFADSPKVVVVDDILGKPASIAYHDSLKQLAQTLHLPVNVCPHKETHTKVECKAPGPFQINIKSRGTAAVMEWTCPHGHIVWKWASQPQFKYGMLAGDYMLSMNILLSGNNYRKISLLFDFMKLGMVDRSSFYQIQDAYCVDTVKDFWNEKRAAIIAQLQSKGPVVVLGHKHITARTS